MAIIGRIGLRIVSGPPIVAQTIVKPGEKAGITGACQFL
jgi:hypothetical protein